MTRALHCTSLPLAAIRGPARVHCRQMLLAAPRLEAARASVVVKATAGPKPTLRWQYCAGGVERLMKAVLLTAAAVWTAFPYLRARPSEAEGCWRLFRERTRQESWQGAMIDHRRLHVAGNLGCAPDARKAPKCRASRSAMQWQMAIEVAITSLIRGASLARPAARQAPRSVGKRKGLVLSQETVWSSSARPSRSRSCEC